MTKLEEFNHFLTNIDLDHYRELYSHIKLVELDMPKEIQALPAIYELYWDNKSNWLRFEDFYEEYKKPIKLSLNDFMKTTQFSKETFEKGLPARIYRTWASLITQIQGGYVCGEIYGYENVLMSSELDWKGIDFRIKSGNRIADIQIKKQTYSAGGMGSLTRQARYGIRNNRSGDTINIIEYEVAPPNRYKQNGEKTKPFMTWCNRYYQTLDLLDNGFVIFKKDMFKKDKLTFSDETNF